MEADLTAEQAECVNRALAGHNFAIVGEGGTGKSFVISEICRAKSWKFMECAGCRFNGYSL